MTINCDVIRDLLPAYIDGLCSEASRELIETHMETCDSCRDILSKMRDEISTCGEKEKIESLRAKRPLKKVRNMVIAIITVAVFFTSSIILSIAKFNTPNPVSSGVGLIRIMFTKTQVVRIQAYPRIYLAKPHNAHQDLIDFMEKQGYRYLPDERMSSTLVFGNDDSKNYVTFSVNGYYSKWVFRE
jgi:hypothetical protein